MEGREESGMRPSKREKCRGNRKAVSHVCVGRAWHSVCVPVCMGMRVLYYCLVSGAPILLHFLLEPSPCNS